MPANWSSPERPPAPAEPRVVFAPSLAMTNDVQPAERLGIAGERAIGACDQDAAQFLAVAGANLDDARIECAGGSINAQNQFEAGGEVKVESAQRHRI